MPTYEYMCNNCNYEFEKFQSISEEPIRQCPNCNKNEVIRKISGGTGVIFKGSGFYKTDYASKQNSKPETKPETAMSKSKTSCCSKGKCNH